MGFEVADRFDDGGEAALSISCSICLEDITNYRDRGFAKLQCGHQFHLDCIGSAFNVKGVMQCPNCSKVEKGQWLYADNSRLFVPLNVDDSVNHEDAYDLNYPESSVWCPFGEFSHISGAVAIDEVEFPTTGYNEIIGQHVDFSEYSSRVSSATHVCPFIAYVHPSSSTTNVGNNGDRYNNHNHYRWLYANAHTHVDHLPSPTRPSVDMPTSGSFVHPFLAGQSASTQGPSSFSSVINHPHLDSSARAWERSQALEAYYQQPSTHRSNTQVHMGSSSDHTHGEYYPSSSRSFHDADNSMLHPFHHVVEREPSHPYPYPYPHERGPFHQTGSGLARQRHGSGRVPSRMQYRL